MHPVTQHAAMPGAAGLAAGFTLLEIIVAMLIMGILMAVGIPSMRGWLGATNAVNATQFYAEGYRTAKGQALANNSRSRLVFTPNASSGQLDWQVDVCFRTGADACAANSGRWSRVDQAATSPGAGTVQTRSILRSSTGLPRPGILRVTPDSTSRAVYFTELGWVDGSIPALTRLDLAPGDGSTAFPASAVVLTLAGAVVTCRPDVAAGDSRRCP